jgi:transposase
MSKMKRQAKSHRPGAGTKPQHPPERREIRLDELKAILERAKTSVLGEDDIGMLAGAVDTLAFLTSELEAKGTSIKRLRNWIFGASTEKTSNLFDEAASDASSSACGPDGGAQPATPTAPADAAPPDDVSSDPAKKRKGHGRNGAESYTGAEQIVVPHAELGHAECCPHCQKGKLYEQAEPAKLLRVTGMAPLSAKRFELQRLRCNLCGEVVTAKAPEGVGEEKYDESATSMIAVLKYGTGLPFHRLERLQDSLGVPLPATTQWDLVAEAADRIEPVQEELVRQAAQGEVLHNDDTSAKILELLAEQQPEPEAAPPEGSGKKADERTGVFTTGIVAQVEAYKIALFFTGRQHAGENLADVLAKRAAELPPPIQMCDALSWNTKGEFETIVANCLTHGRRKFVDVVDEFPGETRFVIETLGDVYRHDAVAREQQMTPEQRLHYHQALSEPLMEQLEAWFREQFDERKVEPNSGLGQAIKYMQKHWEKLTRFLHVAGAPLDNNIVERSLKKAILHRKNALFYKTMNGARVGDLFMSLIHTAELNRVNPFDYLLQLLRHHGAAASAPADWMPWNYRQTMGRLSTPVAASSP